MIRDTPNKMKWQQICQMKTKLSESQNYADDTRSPQYFATQIKSENGAELLTKLKVSLSTEPVYWLNSFCEKGGLEAMVIAAKQITKRDVKSKHDQDLALQWVQCIKFMVNNKAGLKRVSSHNEVMERLVLFLDMNTRVRITVYEVLTVIILLNGANGLKVALELMNYYATKKSEPVRFRHLVDILKYELEDNETSFDLPINSMILINTFTNIPESLGERWELRQEFEVSHLSEILKTVKSKFTDRQMPTALSQQISAFEENEQEDREEYEQKYSDKAKLTFKDVNEVFNALKMTSEDLPWLKRPFFSILRYLHAIPTDNDTG